jgi:hypothetical protein
MFVILHGPRLETFCNDCKDRKSLYKKVFYPIKAHPIFGARASINSKYDPF